MRFADICHTDSTALESGVEVKTLFDCSFAASCQYVLDLDLDMTVTMLMLVRMSSIMSNNSVTLEKTVICLVQIRFVHSLIQQSNNITMRSMLSGMLPCLLC